MASERHIFNLSGPSHLTTVDWKSPHHRRSIAASMVQGVYVLERDRQQNRKGSQSLAFPWWESFHFQLNRRLVDDVDGTIFGAIYEFKPLPSNCHHSTQWAPKYIIAFRGNVPTLQTLPRDLELDLQLIQNDLHQNSRFETAMQAIRNTVALAGDLELWLAGHSLGSAMAMLAGKNMAKEGKFLEAFLFNPPFVSTPIEMIKDERLKDGIRIANSFITAGLTVAMKGHCESSSSEDPFVVLSSWVPSLFVNPEDRICSEYVGYFEHRKKMEKIGAGFIGKLATKNSIGGLILSAFGKESEPLHLLPSAKLTINRSSLLNLNRAHEIQQWWRPDLYLQSKVYLFK